MQLFDLEKILFACSVILALLFTAIGYYLQDTLEYDKNLKKKDISSVPNKDCIKNIRDVGSENGIFKLFIKKMRIDLTLSLIVGCYILAGLFMLNVLINLNDLFLSIPIVRKLFMVVLSVYIVLLVSHLQLVFKKIIEENNKSDCNLEISIKPGILSNFTTASSVIVYSIIGGLIFIQVLPTFLAKTKNVRK